MSSLRQLAGTFRRLWVWVVGGLILVNALADSLTNYFPPETLATPGTLRAIVLAIGLVAGGLALSLERERRGAWFWLPLVLCIGISSYWALVMPIDAPVERPVAVRWVKAVLPMFVLPITVALVRSRADLRRLLLFVLAAGWIIAVQLLVADRLEAGLSVYVPDTFYMGGALIQVSYTLALALMASLVLPLDLPRRRARTTLLVGSGGLFVGVLVVLMRRSTLIATMLALVALFAVSRDRFRVSLRSVLAILLGALLVVAMADSFLPRWEYKRPANRPISAEGRVQEIGRVLEDMSPGSRPEEEGPPLTRILFGTRLFASFDYFGDKREIHSDYMELLHGSGVVGLLLYAALYAIVGIGCDRRLAAARRRDPPGRGGVDRRALLWSVFAIFAVVSFSGSLEQLGFRTAFHAILGALLGSTLAVDDVGADRDAR